VVQTSLKERNEKNVVVGWNGTALQVIGFVTGEQTGKQLW